METRINIDLRVTLMVPIGSFLRSVAIQNPLLLGNHLLQKQNNYPNGYLVCEFRGVGIIRICLGSILAIGNACFP